MNRSDRRVAAGAAVLFGSLAVALCLFVAGAIFGLNGDQWAWWTWASWAGALLMIVAAGFGDMQIAGSGSRTDRPAGVVGALLGGALIAGSLGLMAHNYSDPYSGDLFWPHRPFRARLRRLGARPRRAPLEPPSRARGLNPNRQA